jgi:hypothetical protein
MNVSLRGIESQSKFGFSPTGIRGRYTQNKQHQNVYLKQLCLLCHMLINPSQYWKVYIYKNYLYKNYLVDARNPTNHNPPKFHALAHVKINLINFHPTNNFMNLDITTTTKSRNPFFLFLKTIWKIHLFQNCWKNINQYKCSFKVNARGT